MAKEGEEHFVAKIAQKVVIADGNKVLLVRDPRNKLWEIPGGRLNKGELPEAGVKREVFEELGVTIVLKGLITVNTFVHETEGDHLTLYYSAILENPSADFILEEEEIAEVKWITSAQLDDQPIWEDIRAALEIFFKIR